MMLLTKPLLSPKVRGFTLIELVVVIVVLGVVATGTFSYIAMGTRIYSDVVSRERLLSQSRFVMERITRDLREALPNSVRLAVSATDQCIEFVPIQASSSYIDIPVAPEPAAITALVVQPGLTPVGANKIVVYPRNSTDVYNPFSNRIFSFALAPSAGTGSETVTFAAAIRFGADSPNERYYLVNNAVSYCVNISSGQIHRYSGYWPGLSQLAPPLVAGVLMAENHKVGVFPFVVTDSTLISNSLVALNFVFTANDEELQYNHQVYIVNIP